MPGRVAGTGLRHALDHRAEQLGRPRPADQILHHPSQRPGDPAGHGQRARQPRPAEGHRQPHRDRDDGQGTKLHGRHQWPTDGVRQLVEEPEQVGADNGDLSSPGSQPARQHHHATQHDP